MNESARKKYDLTRGGILDRLLLVALPIIGTQLVQMSYNLTDMFLLGRVGSDAVAASGSAGMFIWLSNGLMLLGRMGAEIGVAQSVGRGDVESARRFSQHSLIVALVVGSIYALVCLFFSHDLIGFFRIREAEVAADAARYLSIVAVAMPGAFVNASVVGTFNGSGNSRMPFFINLTGLGLNILLDPIFIFVLGMGVAGAAIATAIAQTCVCVLMLRALIGRRDRPFERYAFFERMQVARVRQILRWSFPICTESVLFTFFSLFTSRFVALFGAGAIAVYRVGSQIESLSWLTCIGFSTAITAFVGQNYGAGEWGRIRDGVRVSFAAVSAWGVMVTLVLAFAGGGLFAFFLPDETLTEMGRTFLRILAFCQILGCLEAASSGSFRGLGKTLPPSLVSIACNGLRVPLSYALSQTALGLNGIWIGMTVGAAMRGVLLTPWLLRTLRDIVGKNSSKGVI
ncbi:MATE family efflux transporter [Synergistaceae bacterium OttesenSCG-928-I11]|nr:MATE family efflux transporter [Synergistaceae bacterium OttesenSCG-928-I11]